MKKFLLRLFCLLFVSSLNGQVALHGLYTPVQLEADTTVIYLRDYLGGLKAGAVTLPLGLSDRSLKQDTLILTGTPRRFYSVMKIETNEGPRHLLLMRSNAKEISLRIPAEEVGPGPLRLIGAFNNWNRASAPLELKNGYYQASYQLAPGRYEYKLYQNGQELMDPGNPRQLSNGMGGFNNVLVVAADYEKAPGDFDLRYENDRIKINARGGAVEYLAFFNNQQLDMLCSKRLPPDCRIRIPEEASEQKRSYIRIYSWYGDQKGKDMLIPLEYGEPILSSKQLNRQDWHQARLYFLMVDRFQNGDTTNDRPTPDSAIHPKANYQGGDLSGVQQALEAGYFDSLGVNTIWLSPITQNPLDAWGLWDKGRVKSKFSAYHGYWPISNVKVDFRFGDERELDTLLATAHGMGKNMLLDYVANHVHINHPVYQQNPAWATSLYLPDGSKNTEKWDEYRLTTWFDDHLPTLDLTRYEIVDPMVDSALVWLTRFPFDGFRHDATKHIDELYWRTLTYRIRQQTDRPIYQIGETYGSPQLINSYISTGMLDAQFDFNLYDAAVSAFAREGGDLANLKHKLEQGLKVYGNHHLMGNISGNQDRSRFISLASGEVDFSEDQKLAGWERKIAKPTEEGYQRLALLHAFNNAIPGVPCVYYGDEFGLPGAGDPDNRRMMKFTDWDSDEQKLLQQVQQLHQLRGSEMALLFGSTEVSLPKEGVIMIRRRYFEQEVIAVLNVSKSAQKVVIANDGTAGDHPLALGSLTSSSIQMEEDRTSVEIAPLSYQYFTFIKVK